MRNTANEMYLKFYFNDKNVMYMQLSLTGEVSLLDSTSSVVAGPNTIPGGISHWVPFWIDFTNVGHIIVGAGTTEFFDYDTGISETPAYGKFVLQSSSSEKLVYCQQKGECSKPSTYRSNPERENLEINCVRRRRTHTNRAYMGDLLHHWQIKSSVYYYFA